MKLFWLFLQYLLVALVVSVGSFWLLGSDRLQWEAVWSYRSMFFYGLLNTVLISIASLILSLLIGVVAALLRRSKITPCVILAKIYIELIRGTPLLVQILFFFYVVAFNIGLENRFVAGVFILSLFHGAYIAEVIRGGIDNISATQKDSARAIGLTSFQTYRFVIFPQAVRLVIPPLAGQFASIIKDSSLLSIIGINEVTNSAQQINSATYSTLESFFPLAIAYLILTLPISLLSKSFERKFRYET